MPAAKWLYTFDLGELQTLSAMIAGYLILVAILVACWKLRLKHPGVVILLLLMILFLAPVLNVIRVPSFLIAPNRAATAGVAVAGLIAFILGSPGKYRHARLALAGIIFIRWFSLTAWGARQWTNDVHFCFIVTVYDPSCLVVRYNLANSHFLEKRRAAARFHLFEILDYLDRNPSDAAVSR